MMFISSNIIIMYLCDIIFLICDFTQKITQKSKNTIWSKSVLSVLWVGLREKTNNRWHSLNIILIINDS